MNLEIKRGKGLGENAEVYVYASDYDDFWAGGGTTLIVIPGENVVSTEPLFYFKWNSNGMPLLNNTETNLFEIKIQEDGLRYVVALPDVVIETGKTYKIKMINY